MRCFFDHRGALKVPECCLTLFFVIFVFLFLKNISLILGLILPLCRGSDICLKLANAIVGSRIFVCVLMEMGFILFKIYLCSLFWLDGQVFNTIGK